MRKGDPEIIDAEYEVVAPQMDRRPLWERYQITMAPGWWIAALSSGVIALVSSLSR